MSAPATWLRDRLLERGFRIQGRWLERQLRRAARRPDSVQLQVLRRILARQAQTDFGRQYGFASIDSIAAFRERVPVCDYETLRPWFEHQDAQGWRAINASTPLAYVAVKNSAGRTRYLPYHASTLATQRRLQNLFFYRLLSERPRALSGRILAIVGAAIEDYRPGSGLPFGSVSGRLYATSSALLRSKYVVPGPIFSIKDCLPKSLLILRLALQRSDITYISTPNPYTLLALIDTLREHWQALLEDLEKGAFRWSQALSPQSWPRQWQHIEKHLAACPKRAAELRSLPGESVRLEHLWPDLQAAGTWTGGPFEAAMERLRAECPRHTLIRDLGYITGEVHATVPLGGHDAGVPSFQDHFFEFSPWDYPAHAEDRERWLGLEELQNGARYCLFVTTGDGFYRYAMDAVLQVEGFFGRVPKLRFVARKGLAEVVRQGSTRQPLAA